VIAALVGSVRVPVSVPLTGTDGATHDTFGTLSKSLATPGGRPPMLPATSDVPAGMASLIVASRASEGPALVMVRSYLTGAAGVAPASVVPGGGVSPRLGVRAVPT
jgi:hypothetical protein